jgi:hypothetical protein
VTTPLVCVVQHDLAFIHAVELGPLVELMVQQISSPRSPTINTVCFPKERMRSYRQTTRSFKQLEIGDPVQWACPSGGDVHLSRVPQFFDGTHLAGADWYRSIFTLPLLHGSMLGPGQFTEDNLGQYMLEKALLHKEIEAGNDASTGVLEVNKEFGVWLWTGGMPELHHVNGIGSHGQNQKKVPALIYHLDGTYLLRPSSSPSSSPSSRNLSSSLTPPSLTPTTIIPPALHHHLLTPTSLTPPALTSSSLRQH